ncbi:MAG: VOC family protein [Dysgonamonadaceae bacterium]|jgi:PhnB protein|nr:VOC family protein [Dysgonamonadaceae bacterium]
MSLDVFFSFNGNCRKAMEFYANVFGVKMPEQIMTYGENPEGAAEQDKDRVLYACMPMFGMNVMFCDVPSDEEYIVGNNITLTIGISNAEEIKRIFRDLSEDGEVYMPLDKTFFSELFGMVRDRFGVIWQLSKAV